MQEVVNIPTNTGTPAVQPANAAEKSLTFALILLGWQLFTGFIWMIISRALVPVLIGSSGADSVSMLYNVLGSIFDLISIALALVFFILSRHRLARIVLLLYFILHLIFFLFNRIVPLVMDFGDSVSGF